MCVTFRAGGGFGISGGSRPWREIPELRERMERWRKAGLRRISFLSDRPDVKDKLRKLGVEIVVATDLGADIEHSMARDLGVRSPKTVMNETFYLFCPGLKVAVLSAVTAADAGAVPVDREVVSMGGTEQGLDTAIVVKPAYSDEMFHPQRGLEIREIICKPRTMMGPSGFYLSRAWASGAQKV